MFHAMLTIAAASFLSADEAPLLKFERQKIGDVTYEACSVFDVNNDGKPDIVTGEYWFEGPDFKTKHKICTLRTEDDYFDDFADYPMDVNGDGFMDIVSGGWWGETVLWRENPQGKPLEWTNHDIAKIGNVERPMFYDMDGDGKMEVIPNTPGTKDVYMYHLVLDASGKGTGKFEETKIPAEGSHGIGFGDINGDKRVDIVISHGWLEAPADPYKGTWQYHKGEFDLGTASCPILVIDVNGDGHNDLIYGAAHDYGLFWLEQKVDAAGARTWVKHDIDTKRSQYHDMMLADIDKDGKPELVTGKRYRAHAFNDPGSKDPLGVYYFKINGGEFKRYTVDYGPAGQASGIGIYCWVADVDGNGWPDIVCPGKQGMYLFKNLGNK